MMRGLIVAVAVVTVTGCATRQPIELSSVRYEGPTSAHSERSAKVELDYGETASEGSYSSMQIGTAIIPMARPVYASALFGRRDQRTFAETLRQELRRHGVFKKVLEADSTALSDVLIQVRFTDIQYYQRNAEYKITLDVAIAEPDRRAVKQYKVLSSEGQSLNSRMNAFTDEGKARAVSKLLDRVMPDIDAFVLQLK